MHINLDICNADILSRCLKCADWFRNTHISFKFHTVRQGIGIWVPKFRSIKISDSRNCWRVEDGSDFIRSQNWIFHYYNHIIQCIKSEMMVQWHMKPYRFLFKLPRWMTMYINGVLSPFNNLLPYRAKFIGMSFIVSQLNVNQSNKIAWFIDEQL